MKVPQNRVRKWLVLLLGTLLSFLVVIAWQNCSTAQQANPTLQKVIDKLFLHPSHPLLVL
jgi:hypothetical protein